VELCFAKLDNNFDILRTLYVLQYIEAKRRKRITRQMPSEFRMSILAELLLRCRITDYEECSFYKTMLFTGDNGKPYITSQIAFNISHSFDCVVCALSKDVDVIGVDVEKIREFEFAKQVLSEKEYSITID